MEAVARISVNREYYDAFYDDWRRYRAKWIRFRPLIAAGLLVGGIALVALRIGYATGTAAIALGAYQVFEVFTHRRRWLNARLKDLAPDNKLVVSFRRDSVEIESNSGHGTVSYSAFQKAVTTPNGLFLMPIAGRSIYVPRTSFVASSEGSDDFTAVCAHLEANIVS